MMVSTAGALPDEILQAMDENLAQRTRDVLDAAQRRVDQRKEAVLKKQQHEALLLHQRGQIGEELALVKKEIKEAEAVLANFKLGQRFERPPTLKLGEEYEKLSLQERWAKLDIIIAKSSGTGGRGGALSGVAGGERSVAIRRKVLTSVKKHLGKELHKGAVHFSMRRRERDELLTLAQEAADRADWHPDMKDIADALETKAKMRVDKIQTRMLKRYNKFVNAAVERRRSGGDGYTCFYESRVEAMLQQQAFAARWGLGFPMLYVAGGAELLMELASEVLPDEQPPNKHWLEYYDRAMEAAEPQRRARLVLEYHKLEGYPDFDWREHKMEPKHCEIIMQETHGGVGYARSSNGLKTTYHHFYWNAHKEAWTKVANRGEARRLWAARFEFLGKEPAPPH